MVAVQYWLSFFVVITPVFVPPMWRLFTKAGQPGWAALIPVYNWAILWNVAGFSAWNVLWFVVPVANLPAWFFLWYSVAKKFKRDTPFAVATMLLPFIFIYVLARGGSRHMDQGSPRIPARPDVRRPAGAIRTSKTSVRVVGYPLLVLGLAIGALIVLAWLAPR